MSFYSYFLGSELKLVFRWIDVEKIQMKTSLLTYVVKVETSQESFRKSIPNFFYFLLVESSILPSYFENERKDKYAFYFVSEEPYKTMQQLADLACRQLMDGDQVNS